MLLYLPHKANDSEVSFFLDWLLKKRLVWFHLKLYLNIQMY